MSWVQVSETTGTGYFACDMCGRKSPPLPSPGAADQRLQFLSSVGWSRWGRETKTQNGPALIDACEGCTGAFGKGSKLLGAQQCGACKARFFLWRRCPTCKSRKIT